MHNDGPAPTLAEARRMERLPRLGCVACLQKKIFQLSQVHHLNEGGKAGQKRRGHRFTIPLCPWHHEGIVPGELTLVECEAVFGPSYKRSSRRFREVFGSDDELLAQADALLEKREAMVVGRVA